MTLTAANIARLEYGHASDLITELTLQAINAAIPAAGTGAEWAEEYRHLSPERSYRASIGLTKFTFDVTPFMREPTDCATSDPTVHRITFIKSVQISGTTFGENVCGYFMHGDPSKILFICETQEKMKAWSVESLAMMIRDTPVLTNLVKDHRVRDSNNTIFGKKFPGGHLAMAWATSPATLSSRPVRVVVMDECDAYEPTKEGDPRELAARRTTTFGESKKIIEISTPRNRLPNPPGTPPDAPQYSPIEFSYQQSDRRKLWLPCPQCGEFQVLEWENLNRDLACFICQAKSPERKSGTQTIHGCAIEEEHKPEMLAKHQWRAEATFKGHAGFFIWEAYSPWVSWREIIEAYNEAERSGDLQKKKTFWNLSLARGWQDDDSPIETNDLLSRRENYYGVVPDGVLIITCGVDVQGNRLEVQVIGWGLNREKWVLDYIVLDGDPNFRPVWNRLLTDVLTREFLRQDDRVMKIWCTTIDAGGHHSDKVYRFCRENSGRRVYATRGSSTAGQPLISKPVLVGRPPAMRFMGGSETAKDDIFASIRVAKPGPGYFHWPSDETRFGKDYFKQLLSERATVNKKGKRVYKLINPDARNEALDTTVQNYYAFAIINPPLERLARMLNKAKKKEREEPGNQELAADRGSSPTVREGSQDVPRNARIEQREYPTPPYVPGFKKCDKPDCDRLVLEGRVYCCHGCMLAAEGKYEIHEDGPLGHSKDCTARQAAIMRVYYPRPEDSGSADVRTSAPVSEPGAVATGSSEPLATDDDAGKDARAPKRRKRRRRGNFATNWKRW